MAVGLGSSAQYVDIQLARNEISGMSSLVTITERLVEQLNEQKNPKLSILTAMQTIDAHAGKFFSYKRSKIEFQITFRQPPRLKMPPVSLKLISTI